MVDMPMISSSSPTCTDTVRASRVGGISLRPSILTGSLNLSSENLHYSKYMKYVIISLHWLVLSSKLRMVAQNTLTGRTKYMYFHVSKQEYAVKKFSKIKLANMPTSIKWSEWNEESIETTVLSTQMQSHEPRWSPDDNKMWTGKSADKTERKIQPFNSFTVHTCTYYAHLFWEILLNMVSGNHYAKIPWGIPHLFSADRWKTKAKPV